MDAIRRILLLTLVMAAAALAAAKPVREAFVLRGHEQILYHVPAETQQAGKHLSILFIPGDGGWHGAAVDMARMMASLGYEVYGLDVRRYLESFTKGHGALTGDQMAADMEQAVRQVASTGGRPLLLAGWSQGAAMAILTAARMDHKELVSGVLTIALPESGFLGWRWRDSVRALFGSDAREPEFQVAPLLPDVAPVPFWTIYGTRDRFTPATAARRLVSLARRPARRREIEGGNHGLDGHRAQLLTSLKSGLAWLEVPRFRVRRAAF
jgi:pimeloyl-ACP methyl ester carboxylesterase